MSTKKIRVTPTGFLTVRGTNYYGGQKLEVDEKIAEQFIKNGSAVEIEEEKNVSSIKSGNRIS